MSIPRLGSLFVLVLAVGAIVVAAACGGPAATKDVESEPTATATPVPGATPIIHVPAETSAPMPGATAIIHACYDGTGNANVTVPVHAHCTGNLNRTGAYGGVAAHCLRLGPRSQ